MKVTLFMNRMLALGLVVAAPAILMAGGESDSGTSSAGGAAMVASGQFSEAPMLAAMVAAGELPPLEERIAVEPVVQEMLADGVGKYGGTLRVSDATGAMNRRGHEMTNQEVDIYLLKMHQETREILPNIAKGYDVSADGLTVTLELRPGAKWSNGDPFVVDDIMFVMEDLRWDDRVDPGWRPNETPPTATSITKIDDYTMQFNLSARDHVIIPGWTTWKGGNYVQYAPSTHLKQWHIRYNPDAQKLAEEEGFETWGEAVVAHWDIVVGVGLLETPTMFPWVPKEIGAQAEIWERNAYFWKVDPAGQQLPYIDRVLSTPNADVEVFNLKAIAGEVDWAIAQTNFASLPDYKENEDRGNYTITLIPGIDVGRAFGFNPTYKDEKYRALMDDVRFRRAMSVALDRDELNEVYFLGLGRPTAATIHSGARFYRPEWQTLWATYDPDLANQLLDEIGLDGRDRDGFRTFPDGSNLTIQVAARTGGSVDISKLFEIEIAQWGDVGLRVVPRLVDNAAWTENQNQDEFMLQPASSMPSPSSGTGSTTAPAPAASACTAASTWPAATTSGRPRAWRSSAASASWRTTAANCPAPSRPRSGSATSSGSGISGPPSSAPPSGSRLRRRCTTGPATTCSSSVPSARRPRSCSPARTCATSRPSSRSPTPTGRAT